MPNINVCITTAKIRRRCAVEIFFPYRRTQDEKCSGAPCWTTHRGTVAGGRDAFLVIAPLAPVGVGRTAGTVREPVTSLIHGD